MKKSEHSYQETLLQKYIDGNITDEERHELEKIALDDPFLFEALEGYHASKRPDISTSQPQLPNKSSTGKIVRLPNYMKIAAGLLLLVSLSFLIWNQRAQTNRDLALSQEDIEIPIEFENEPSLSTITDDHSESESNIDGDPTSKVNDSNSVKNPLANKTEQSTIPDDDSESRTRETDEEDDAPTPSVIASDNVIDNDHQASVSEPHEGIQDDQMASVALDREMAQKVKTEESVAANSQQADLQSSTTESEGTIATAKRERRIDNLRSQTSRSSGQNKSITGHVVDNSGEPLVGATIKIPTNALTVVTDTNGQFEVNIPAIEQFLNVSYKGYEDVSYPIDIEESKLEIMMEDSKSILSKVTFDADAAKSKIPRVKPIRGYRETRRFIESQKINSTCSSSGKVILEFYISEDGNLDNFEVKRSLAPACDEAAIQLLKKAGKWKTIPANKYAKGRFTIKF